MVAKFGQTANTQGAQQAPASNAQRPIDNRPPEATYNRGYSGGGAPSRGGRDDDAVDYKDGDDAPMDGSGGGRWKKADEFDLLPAGEYDFICAVNSIVRWHFGVILTFRVIDGPERGRDIDWSQSPPDKMSDKGREFWRRQFFSAYAAGGWTVAPDPSRNWDGWEPSSKRGSDGKPLPLPPYDRFFVGMHLAGGLGVPCALRVSVRVDEGYEKFPKITSVSLLRDAAGNPVQAPAPFKVIQWVAERNGWRGVIDDKIGASGKTTQPVLRLDQKQVPKGAGGLTWYVDALKAVRDSMRNSNISPGADDCIPF